MDQETEEQDLRKLASDTSTTVDLHRLTMFRAAELLAFEKQLGVAVCTTRAVTSLQRLPVRLRRRATSNHPNRLPRRLHRSDPIGKSAAKTCRRKQRRQRERWQLLRSRAVNSAGGRWLPTHLWHAKRFHFVNKWGHRLPTRATDKLFKATQKSAQNKAALFDMSYWHCLQLSHPELISLLTRFLDQGTLTAGQESQVVLRDPGKSQVLGPGSVTMLRADLAWLWLHPAIAFSARAVLAEHQADLAISDRTCDLGRFKLLGEQSHQILVDVLGLPSQWQTHRSAALFTQGQLLAWQTPAGFRHKKPRLKLNNRYWLSKTLNKKRSCAAAVCPMDLSTISALWDRDGVQLDAGHFPAERIAQLRGQIQAEGSPDLSHVPVLLIQNGTMDLAISHPHCSGWDVVIPRVVRLQHDVTTSVVCRDFLVACHYRGVIVGGQRDLVQWSAMTVRGSQASLYFPYLAWPDTQAGRDEERQQFALARERYLSQQKRTRHQNCIKFLREVEFEPAWTLLVNAQDFYVLRDSKILRLLAQRMIEAAAKPGTKARVTTKQLQAYDANLLKALVPVFVECTGRGSPKQRSVVYLGTQDVVGVTLIGGMDPPRARASALALVSLARLCQCYDTHAKMPLGFFLQTPKNDQLRSVKIHVVTCYS